MKDKTLLLVGTSILAYLFLSHPAKADDLGDFGSAGFGGIGSASQFRVEPTTATDAVINKLNASVQHPTLRPTAAKILNETANITHAQTRSYILHKYAADPSVKAYRAARAGTINVSPAHKDKGGMTATDRRVRRSSKYVGSKYHAA